jgi:hypothetical protein
MRINRTSVGLPSLRRPGSQSATFSFFYQPSKQGRGPIYDSVGKRVRMSRRPLPWESGLGPGRGQIDRAHAPAPLMGEGREGPETRLRPQADACDAHTNWVGCIRCFVWAFPHQWGRRAGAINLAPTVFPGFICFKMCR